MAGGSVSVTVSNVGNVRLEMNIHRAISIGHFKNIIINETAIKKTHCALCYANRSKKVNVVFYESIR